MHKAYKKHSLEESTPTMDTMLHQATFLFLELQISDTPSSSDAPATTSRRSPTTSKCDRSIFGGTSSEMVEHGIFPSVMEADDDDEPHHMAFILGNGDEMVEHGTYPSNMAACGNEFVHIEHESEFTKASTRVRLHHLRRKRGSEGGSARRRRWATGIQQPDKNLL